MRTLFTLLILSTSLLSGCDAFSSATGTPDGVDIRYLVEGNAEVAYQDADGVNQAQARGRWETQFTAPSGAVLSLEAISSDGSPVRAQIEVGGIVVRVQQGVAVQLDSRADSSPTGTTGEIEVHGPVEALGADRVTVRGHVFVVDGQTRLFDEDNETVPLSTFSVGTWVEAEGRANRDGTWQAKKIKLDDD